METVTTKRHFLNSCTGPAILVMMFVVGAFIATAPVPALAASEPGNASHLQGQVMERTFPVSSGQLLELDLKTGASITITGWDQAVVSARVESEGQDLANTQVDFAETSSGIRITTHSSHSSGAHGPGGGLKVDIMVPRQFDLEIDSHGGSISISDVNGKMTGKTMGGPLNLTRLTGVVRLKTMGGNIQLTDSDVDGEVSTMGGEVLVQDVVGNIKGSSMGGNVVYKNMTKRDGSSTGEVVHITTMGGEIELDDAPAGAEVKTMGGNIHIRSAAKFVRATTMGGDIKIDAVDGGAKAKTMGGNVTVTMVGDPNQGDRDVELTSMGGDITLTVPAGLSMTIEITLALTKDSKEDYQIYSDFPMSQEDTYDQSDQDGAPARKILGRGIVGTGENSVKIKTTNGNVYLKRGS